MKQIMVRLAFFMNVNMGHCSDQKKISEKRPRSLSLIISLLNKP